MSFADEDLLGRILVILMLFLIEKQPYETAHVLLSSVLCAFSFLIIEEGTNVLLNEVFYLVIFYY